MPACTYPPADVVRAQAPGCAPRIGVVLGSGLGGLAHDIDNATVVSFAELPGFPEPTVDGHAGNLVVGKLAGVEVACLQGRVHLYEGHHASSVTTPIRTLSALGCTSLVVTNAAGALDADAKPGELMLVTDHINAQGTNPLVGPNDARFGPRFPAMTGAYDPQLRARMHARARARGLTLREGVYLSVLGPCFETPAEIRMFQGWGASAVGMSTVPEVIVARHCGMACVAVSVLTNLGAGLANEDLSHEQTLAFAQAAASSLRALVCDYVASFVERPAS